MAKIENEYTIWWTTFDNIIQNDHTQSLKGLNVNFATAMVDSIDGHIITSDEPLNQGATALPCITHYHSDKLDDLEKKIVEKKLKKSKNDKDK